MGKTFTQQAAEFAERAIKRQGWEHEFRLALHHGYLWGLSAAKRAARKQKAKVKRARQ